MRALHNLFLAGLFITIVVVLIPYITTRQDWLFVAGAVSLVGAIITRLALDAKEFPNEKNA
jgi:hypothetical protein